MNTLDLADGLSDIAAFLQSGVLRIFMQASLWKPRPTGVSVTRCRVLSFAHAKVFGGAVEVYSVSERLSWCLMYSAGEIYRTWAPGGGDVGRILHPTLLGSLGYL